MLVHTKKKMIRLGYLKRTAMGNKKFLKEVMELFIVQVPEELERLERTLMEKDWSMLADISHKMKLSVNVMGMKESEKILADMEAISSRNSSPDETIIAAGLQKLKDKCFIAIEEVKQVIVEWGL